MRSPLHDHNNAAPNTNALSSDANSLHRSNKSDDTNSGGNGHCQRDGLITIHNGKTYSYVSLTLFIYLYPRFGDFLLAIVFKIVLDSFNLNKNLCYYYFIQTINNTQTPISSR